MPPDKPADLFLGDLPAENPFNLFIPFDYPDDIANSDSEDSNVFSGVSSPGRTARRGMRSFPPVQMWSGALPTFSGDPLAVPDPAGHLPAVGYRYDHDNSHDHFQMNGNAYEDNNLALMQKADTTSAIPTLWADLYDQRRRARQYRKKMSELRNQILELRSKKAKADNALQRLALSHSQSGRTLPLVRSALLVENVRGLQDECTSVEAQYERLGKELDRREEKLELSEVKFFQSISTGADAAWSGPPVLAKIPFLHPSGSGPVQNGTSRGNDRQARTAPATAYSPTSSDASLLGISGERPVDVHPLYTLLLQTISTLNMSKENFEDLINEREDILEDLRSYIVLERNRRRQDYDLINLTAALASDPRSDRFRTAFTAYLDKSDLEFLQSFGELESASQNVILAHERQVASIRETCVRMAVLPNHLSFEERLLIFGNDHESDDDGTVAVISTEDPRTASSPLTTNFPILVTNPLLAIKQYPLTAKDAVRKVLALPDNDPQRRLLLDDYVKEYGILSSLTRSAAGNKADFVNRWILQSLRMSPMAAVQLYTVFSAVLRVVNIAQWQKDVVHFWTRDGTNVPDQYFYGPVTELTSSTSTTSASFIVDR